MKKTKKTVKKSLTKKTKPVQRATPKNTAGIVPLGDRVLVRPLSEEETGTPNSFGLIIPETVDKEKPEQGTVVAVGPGKKNEDGKVIPLSVKPGDRVMFSKYGFDEVKINGIEYVIVAESNILAVLN